MDDKRINNLETKLEQLVEGAFTHFFRKRVSAHDIAIKLIRSMEDNLRFAEDNDPRPIAPDTYHILLNPRNQTKLQDLEPTIGDVLREQLIDIAVQSGYRLSENPTIKLIADTDLDAASVIIRATYSSRGSNTTASMQPIKVQKTNKKPQNPHLILNGGRQVQLTKTVFNIGRSVENDLVVDDPYISRHHIQLRLRFGKYTLFDVNSRAGTLVNNVRVTEHLLQTGDVIMVGSTQIMYMSDEGTGHNPTTTTSRLDPV